MSSKDNNKERQMYSKSDDKADEVIEEFFQSLLSR